jgi:hypothetical protein
MSEVEAIKQLTEVVRGEEFIITIGWLAWVAGMIIIGGLLFLILQRLPQRSMTVEEARKIAKEIIEELRSNR